MQSKSIKYPGATKSGQIGLCKPLLDMFPCTFVVLMLITTIFLLLAYGLVQWFDGSFMIGVNKDGYWVPCRVCQLILWCAKSQTTLKSFSKLRSRNATFKIFSICPKHVCLHKKFQCGYQKLKIGNRTLDQLENFMAESVFLNRFACMRFFSIGLANTKI